MEDSRSQLTYPPPVPTGVIKAFGRVAEQYEVGNVLRQIENGDWMMEIIIVASEERAEYRLTYIYDDPEAV